MLLIILFLCVSSVLGDLNTGSEATSVCRPDQNTVDGAYYCTDYFEGWDSGGAARAQFVQKSGARCYKAGKGDCMCPDCGFNAIADVQCKDWRCDDESGFYDAETKSCYTIDPSTGQRKSSGSNDYKGCYKARKACDNSMCKLGQHLVGCKRASAGLCTNCTENVPVLGVSYWSRPGVCRSTACTPVPPGKFIQKACTLTSDVVLSSCDAYPGNPNSVLRADTPKYYCPGQGLVLPLPAFSVPTVDYGGFVCIEGYYLLQGACQQCPQGSACKYGRKFTCPENYYQRFFGESKCHLCTHECANGEAPYRCLQGSTTDVGCVSCGMCGYSLATGHLCNEDTREMSRMASVCSPLDAPGDMARCA